MALSNLRKMACAVAAGAALLAGVSGASAQQTLQMASLSPASPTTVFSIAVSQIIDKDFGYKTQLATGSSAVRQAVDAANQKLDLFVSAVSINNYLKNGEKMYANLENAPELFSNLRSLVNYPLGAYHGIAWADSGIESMMDLKGKKVFVGPPASAGRVVVENVIRGVTGYEPDKDFETVNLDWSSAEQAFQDHQLDAYFVPTPIPSPELAQISALGEFRILGIPDDKIDSEGVKAAAAVPGRSFVTVPPHTYERQANAGPTRLVASTVGLATNKWLPDDVAYNITKAIFEHHDDLVASAKWMGAITPETALFQMNAPLHPGAYRYYKEIGVEVPEELIPPEAK